MARAMKASGGGASTKRKDRRQAKFTPGPGPGSVKPVGVADAPPDAPAAAKPSKTVNGKMSKKRKAEVFGRGGEDGGGEQKGDGSQKKKGKSSDTFFANKTGAKDEFASKKPHSGGDKKADHSKAPATKQEQKELANQQKALVKPNHAVIQEMVGYWEKLRSKKVSGKKLSPEEKKVLVDAIAKASLGKVPTLANNHKGSRVIQALLKFGTEAQKKSVYKECTPAIAQLAKSLYGHFLVKKLIDDTDKKSIPSLLQHVKGQVRALAKHPVGSQVLESLYFPAPPKEKLQMRCEFYGSEFAFFGAGGADGDAKNVSAPKNLRDAMKSKPRAQRQGMLRQMNASLLPILEKGLVSPSLVHAALCEYLV
jgi:pumilio family protein 6